MEPHWLHFHFGDCKVIRPTEENFLVYCMQNYDNPHCHDIAEFEEDLKRFQYLRKLFGRYKSTGELKDRLILNHLIILYNCFGSKTTALLFLKLEDFHDCLSPFISYLNYMPELVHYNQKIINTSNIVHDSIITQKLKEI